MNVAVFVVDVVLLLLSLAVTVIVPPFVASGQSMFPVVLELPLVQPLTAYCFIVA